MNTLAFANQLGMAAVIGLLGGIALAMIAKALKNGRVFRTVPVGV